nr:sodium-dependent nutrient amino acid transporter 1-like isoform X1 [Onthophagus taurus]XP_022918399.1 sodium-dependent nutrient amino acid transporter 1-like isoform X1 [Onthophagus taurus]
MLYIFLSSYTKKSFFTIWQCVPIFEGDHHYYVYYIDINTYILILGFGYTLAMSKLLYELTNVTIASYCVIMLVEVVRYRTYNMQQYCSGYEVTPNCDIPKRNCTNKTNNPLLVGTQYYFRNMMINYDRFSPACCWINIKHIIIFAVLWVLIFLISILGIERIVKALVKLIFVAVIILFLISCFVLLNVNKYYVHLNQPAMPLGKFIFWLEIVLHTNTPASLAHTLWLGTLLPKNFSPKSAALILAIAKTFICLILMCFSSLIIHDMLYTYSFADPLCLITHGVDVIITFVPDVLFKLHFGQLTAFLWYLAIALIALITPIFSIVAIVDSICQSKPSFNSRRIIVYGFCCVIGLIMSIPYTSNIGFGFLSYFSQKGMLLLKSIFLLLVNISFIFLYSTTRIIEDYTFTYGSAPHLYWQFLWRTVPLFSLYLLIFMIYELNYESYLSHFYDKYIAISSYIIMAVIISPVFIIAIAKIFHQIKYRSFKKLLRPADTWGPSDIDQRIARQFFFPEREIKYRNMPLRCNHHCLANSGSFDEEHSRQIRMLHDFAMVHQEELDPNMTDFVMNQ